MKTPLQKIAFLSARGAFLSVIAAAIVGCAASSSPVADRSNARGASRDESFVRPQSTTVSTGSNFVQNTNVSGNNADTPSRTSVYGQGDIQRTGSSSVGESLRRLDPSIH